MNTPLGRRWKLSEMKCLLVGLGEGLIFTSDPSTGRCSSRNQKSWTSPGPVLRLSSQGGRENSPEVVDVTRCRCHTETPISPSLSQRGKQRLTFQVWIKASAPRAVASFNKFYAAIFLRIGCLSRVDSFTFWKNKTWMNPFKENILKGSHRKTWLVCFLSPSLTRGRGEDAVAAPYSQSPTSTSLPARAYVCVFLAVAPGPHSQPHLSPSTFKYFNLHESQYPRREQAGLF